MGGMGGGMAGGLGMGLSGPTILSGDGQQGNRFGGAPAPFAVPGQQLGPGGMSQFGAPQPQIGRAPPGMQMNPDPARAAGLLGGNRGVGNIQAVQDPSVLSVGSAVLGMDNHPHQNMGAPGFGGPPGQHDGPFGAPQPQPYQNQHASGELLSMLGGGAPGGGGPGPGVLGNLGPGPRPGEPPKEEANFDMSEFPALANRGGGAGGGGGQGDMGLSMPRGFSAAAERSDFAIQSEDFPALGGGAPRSKDGHPGLGPGGLDSGLGANMAENGGLHGGNEHMQESGEAISKTTSVSATGFSSTLADSSPQGPDGDVTATDADRFGLRGLLTVIRMTDQDLNTLALGTDLTTLGLNLNSPDCLYATFASPWADSPSTREPQYTLPLCYYMQPPALKTSHLSKFQLETLFHIFYAMPKDILQAYAAQELYNREWRYHMDLKLWFKRATQADGLTNAPGVQYIYFDINAWERRLFAGSIHGGLNAGLLSEEEVRVKFAG